jgi:hypothetical protein
MHKNLIAERCFFEELGFSAFLESGEKGLVIANAARKFHWRSRARQGFAGGHPAGFLVQLNN